MADNRDIFKTSVVPIMDRVRDDLQRKQSEEFSRHTTSFGALMAGAAGPDGGMSAMSAYDQRIYYIGEWNTKTVEDYIDMVKDELRKKHITVDAVMEEKMVDHLINQRMPKSTADYLLRKAAEGSLFYLPQRARTSALQDHINKDGDKRHNPSFWEEATGSILGWATNVVGTAGMGGFWGQTAMDVAVEGANRLNPNNQEKYLADQRALGKKEVAAASKKSVTIPKWMLTQMGFDRIADATDQQLTTAQKWAKGNASNYRKSVDTALKNGSRTVKTAGKTTTISVADATTRAMQYEAFVKAIQKEQEARRVAEKETQTGQSAITEAQDISATMQAETTTTPQTEQQGTVAQTGKEQQQTLQSIQNTGNYDGWNNLLDSVGLSGIGNTFQHLGLTLATLPDMLLGVFTGRTKSVGLNKSTMIPLAALISGTFIKNPLLKIPLMLYGGANLVNKVGQEAMDEYRQEHGLATGVRYKQYPDEPLNERITNPHIESNVLIVDIDHVPRIVTLPPSLVDAYQAGAVPLNTLANRILAKTEQMELQSAEHQTQDVSRRYEQGQEREQVRGIR